MGGARRWAESERTMRTHNPPRTPAFLGEANTRRVKRTLLEGMASRRPDQAVTMVTRARRRGTPYHTIAEWLGPRASCPPQLLAVYDRVQLLASVEP